MRVGFLEESEGVRSMTRLCALLFAFGGFVLLVSLSLYLHRAGADAGVIAAAGTVVVGVGGSVWVALRERA